MRSRTDRGFTLIELMVSVAIVGILSSVALPSYQSMTLRTRKAERDVVMTAVNRGLAAILVRDGRFEADFDGLPNPRGTPNGQKRLFDLASGDMAPWRKVDLAIEGALYHSYSFLTVGAELSIIAEGDLDADGVSQKKIETYLVDDALSFKLPTESAPNPQFIPPGDVAF